MTAEIDTLYHTIAMVSCFARPVRPEPRTYSESPPAVPEP